MIALCHGGGAVIFRLATWPLRASRVAAGERNPVNESSAAIRISSSPRPADVQVMSTDQLRRAFLIERVIGDDVVNMVFTDLDRLAIGGVKPTGSALGLENRRETGTDFFLQRRELG